MKKNFSLKTLFLLILLCFSIQLVVPAAHQTVTAATQSSSQKQGLVKKGKNYYFYSAKGKKVKNCWKKINGRIMYFKSNGKAAKYAKNIKGRRYVFNQYGRLLKPSRSRIVAVEQYRYYVTTKGRPAGTGWQIVDGRLYYVLKSGRCLTNCTRESITLTSGGYAADNTNSRLKIKTMSILSSITRPGMSTGQKLAASWNYIVGGGFHYAGKYPNIYAAGWQRSTALDMLNSHSGNCYSYACAFAALAHEIGYSVTVVCGRVPGSRDGAADGYTRHAWVIVNGRHYDPEAQYAGWARGIYGTGSYPVGHQIIKYVAF